MALSAGQRNLLTALSLAGLLGPNGIFVYFALFRRSDLLAALSHPVTLAFVSEAFLVMILLAVLIAHRPAERWGWRSFVVMSLAGGLGFSIPAFIVLNSRKDPSS